MTKRQRDARAGWVWNHTGGIYKKRRSQAAGSRPHLQTLLFGRLRWKDDLSLGIQGLAWATQSDNFSKQTQKTFNNQRENASDEGGRGWHQQLQVKECQESLGNHQKPGKGRKAPLQVSEGLDPLNTSELFWGLRNWGLNPGFQLFQSIPWASSSAPEMWNGKFLLF